MNKSGIEKNEKERLPYYKYSIYSFLVAPLIFVLAVIPVAPAFASEEVDVTGLTEIPVEEAVSNTEKEGEQENEVVEEETVEVVEEESEESEVVEDVSEEENVEEETATTTPEESEQEEETGAEEEVQGTSTTTEGVSEEESNEEEAESNSDTGEEISTTTPEEVEDTASTTDETNEDEENVPEEESAEEQEQEEKATTTPDEVEEESKAEDEEHDTASTTKEKIVEDIPDEQAVDIVSYVINDSNRYQFSVDDCVPVGDGSFYCNKEDINVEQLEDAIYAAPDDSGDQEIYIRKDGVSHKITDNTQDDLAPFYDPESERLVWHRLMNGRYQIISYDLKEAEEEQLTDTRYNNMQPTAFDNLTVWQAWIGNNWEILLFDGATTTRLSDNEGHDVAPHVRGDFIMWQTEFGSEWRVSVYDRTNGSIELIEAGAGTQLENPRFVLVYDSKDENGDVATYGYDLDKKEVIPLGSTPATVPNDIPEPDQTGEIRAIIQKTSNEEDLIEDVLDKDIPEPEPEDIHDLSSNTTESVLVIPPLEDENASTTYELINIEELTLDLSTSTLNENIEEEASTSSVEHIEDVVIQS